MEFSELDHPFRLIHEEMKRGFDGIHERLDRLNGQVRRHGEQIAVLENQATTAARSSESTFSFLTSIQKDFTSHRARCPFDKDGNPAIDITQLGCHGSTRRRDAAIGASTGAAIMAALIEGLPRLLTLFSRTP